MRMLITLGAMLTSTIAFGQTREIQRDIAYMEPRDERQTLDVYPATRGDGRPVVIWIHGGGWQAGDKSDVDAKPRAFVDKGYVFVSVNYRLLPSATIRQMAEDVAKAIRLTHDHAKEYGGDPDAIFVMGHSAGAQLAALVCTDERYLKAEGLSFSMIKGCVPIDGDTYDVRLQIATVDPETAKRYRTKFGDESRQVDLSPVSHVAKGKSIPPFLIPHVAKHPETRGQSHRFVKTLVDAGVSARTFPAEGKTHETINSGLGVAGDAPTKAIFDFMDEAMGRSKKTP